MRLCSCSWNKPPKRYTFSVTDSAGFWGTVTVGATDYEAAKRFAQEDLVQLPDSGVRVGYTLKLMEVHNA